LTTIVELSEEELAALRKATNQSDSAAAVRMAAVEYLRHVKRMQLRQLPGQVEMLDNWAELERLEISELSDFMDIKDDTNGQDGK